MPGKKEVTIYDIARLLKISSSTVSRALQNHPAINVKTRQKIHRMAEALGYRANYFARSLRMQQTKIIGVIVHELNSNFITSVLAGIEKVTAEAGYDLLIAHSSESYKKEKSNANNLFHKRVDGLISSLSLDTTNLDHFKPFLDKAVPIIFFDRVDVNGNNPIVIIDNAHCGYMATQHLIDQDCRRIAHITSNLNRNVYSHRYEGYRAALFDNEIDFDESLLIVNDLTEKAAVDSATQILKMNLLPDGIFITNDFVAAVCMRTFKKYGVVIPDDIAIVGFNNDAIGNLIEPSLTTINYPGIDIGEIAARNLINQLSGLSAIHPATSTIVAAELIIRKSSLKRKGSQGPAN